MRRRPCAPGGRPAEASSVAAARASRTRAPAVAAALATVLTLLWLVLRFSPYPALETFLRRPYSLVALDRNGGRLAVFAVDDGIRREPVVLGELPRRVLDRFLEAEDRRFFVHPGFDPLALMRAAFQGAAAGRVVSGGSTITMQLARMVRPREGGIVGKLREALDAARLELRLGKRRILELYLSNVPYGRGAEGIESAAFAYFGRRACELGDYEAALLAVLPRSPSRYDPAAHPEELAQAAVRVFARAPLGRGHSREELFALFRSAAKGARRGVYPNRAPHFLRDALLPASTARRADAQSRAVPGEAAAFRLVSSLDPEIQRTLETTLKDGVAGWERARLTNAAGIVLDAVTGEILAWVGSVDFYDEEARGQMDGVLAPGQPGSCLKPFLYALALDHGFTPATVLPDLPLEFGGGAVYIPLNFNNRYNGPVRLRVALASSLNVPAVYVLNRLGVQSFADFLIQIGFESMRTQRDDVGVGLALGNARVTLLELARAFSIFVRDGRPLVVTPFAKGGRVFAAQGGHAFAHSSTASEPPLMSHYAAVTVRSMLSDPASRFTGFGEGKAFAVPYDAIFKTGTANQYQHVWALGATERHVVGVWMGNFTGETIIGRTGSGIPARAVARVLSFISESGRVFAPPEGVEKARICALSGGLATDACPATVEELFRPKALPEPCSWHRPGLESPVFPPEYAAWLAQGARHGAADGARVGASAVAGIVRPRDGAVFWFDPSRPASDQAILIQVANPGAPGLELFHDGEALSGGSDGRFLVPVHRGSHEVLLVLDGDVTERVRYEVR